MAQKGRGPGVGAKQRRVATGGRCRWSHKPRPGARVAPGAGARRRWSREAKAEAKAKAKNNQLKIKAGKGRLSPEGMQDLAAPLDEGQPKGKGAGSREDPAHAGMEEIGLLAGNGGDLIRRWLL